MLPLCLDVFTEFPSLFEKTAAYDGHKKTPLPSGEHRAGPKADPSGLQL